MNLLQRTGLTYREKINDHRKVLLFCNSVKIQSELWSQKSQCALNYDNLKSVFFEIFWTERTQKEACDHFATYDHSQLRSAAELIQEMANWRDTLLQIDRFDDKRVAKMIFKKIPTNIRSNIGVSDTESTTKLFNKLQEIAEHQDSIFENIRPFSRLPSDGEHRQLQNYSQNPR